MKTLLKLNYLVILSFFFALTFCTTKVLAQSDVIKNAQVNTTNAGLSVKVAPGDLIPVSVNLSNFGGGHRVDVLVKYQVLDGNGIEVYSSSETVAVETTNNFIKNIQLPFGINEGKYTAITSISYMGQEVPATTEFNFQVELKILGMFKTDFLFFSLLILIISAGAIALIYSLFTKGKKSRIAPLDYSNIPGKERIFYELISDTIMQMRQRVGDKALEIAMEIEGIEIDENTGRILSFKEKPSKVIAQLVSGYEKALGKQVSFALRDHHYTF